MTNFSVSFADSKTLMIPPSAIAIASPAVSYVFAYSCPSSLNISVSVSMFICILLSSVISMPFFAMYPPLLSDLKPE